jgi:hypothetical protein
VGERELAVIARSTLGVERAGFSHDPNGWGGQNAAMNEHDHLNADESTPLSGLSERTIVVWIMAIVVTLCGWLALACWLVSDLNPGD